MELFLSICKILLGLSAIAGLLVLLILVLTLLFILIKWLILEIKGKFD